MFTQGVNYASVKSKTSFSASGEARGNRGGCWLRCLGSLGKFILPSPCSCPGEACRECPPLPGKVGECSQGQPGAGIGFVSSPSHWSLWLHQGQLPAPSPGFGIPWKLHLGPGAQRELQHPPEVPGEVPALTGALDTSLLRGAKGKEVQ